MFKDAQSFITQMYQDLNKDHVSLNERLEIVQQEIESTGTYCHTQEELIYGARLAWRNSNRCIGRLFWDKLEVKDLRHIDNETDIINALENHIKYATNGGRIIPTISIFKPDTSFKLHNDQLIRYSNDPIVRPILQQIEDIQSSKVQSKFLPWLYTYNGETKVHPIDESIILDVPLTHPQFPKFDALNLTWYAVPIISSMDLNIGGVIYTLMPFNGWYMVSEIASRNLLDTYRYDLLNTVANAFDLDTSKTSTYWRDKALVELNYAVHQSYKSNNVSIVDHYTASKQFEKFEQNESQCGRQVTGDWTWLIPPISPSLVHNWHKGYDNTYHNPNFYYKKKPTKQEDNHSNKCPYH